MHIVHDGVNAHLRLNFKALGDHREGLHKLVAEGPVSRHNILDIVAEQQLNTAPDQTVAQVVKGSGILREVGRGQPVADYHIRLPIQDPVCHIPGVLGRIGVIAIGHDVALGINFPEHPADHVALALHIFVADHCPSLGGQLRGAV